MGFLGQIGRLPYRDLGIRIGNEIGFVVGRFEFFFLFGYGAGDMWVIGDPCESA
jgi:hypothetical protein